MPKSYIHVTYKLRCQISALRSSGCSIRVVASKLGLAPSTICRELKRNSETGNYCPDYANRLSKRRRHKAVSKPKKLGSEFRAEIIKYLKLYLSPEQISGYLFTNKNIKISHESIYRLIWEDKRRGGKLYQCLRQRGKKRQQRSNSKAGVRCIPNRVDIADRPKSVEHKSQIGDWEGDTVIGADNSGVLVTLVDRHSKFVLIKKIQNKTSKETLSAIIDAFYEHRHKVQTITFDNGGEFAKHEAIARILGVSCYFAKPYHSWERGLNEHTNGLIRQFFPKGTNFKDLTHQQIQEVQNLLNHRPRKILNFKTPFEIFHGCNDPNYDPSVALHG